MNITSTLEPWRLSATPPSVRDLTDAFGTSAFALLIVFFSIPCALPLPGTGISTPFGVAVLLLSLQMAIGRETLYLPEWILKLTISGKTLDILLKSIGWIERQTNRFFRPRFAWIDARPTIAIFGVVISILAILIQAPLPLANVPPGLVILGLALALLERDGVFGFLFLMLSLLVIAAYLAFGIYLAVNGTAILEQIF